MAKPKKTKKSIHKKKFNQYNDIDYASKLSPKDRQWLKNFVFGYYFNYRKAGKKVKLTNKEMDRLKNARYFDIALNNQLRNPADESKLQKLQEEVDSDKPKPNRLDLDKCICAKCQMPVDKVSFKVFHKLKKIQVVYSCHGSTRREYIDLTPELIRKLKDPNEKLDILHPLVFFKALPLDN